MRIIKALNVGAVGAALVAGLLFVPVGQAQAATPDGVASIGSASITMAGQANSLAALAQCNVHGQATASATARSIPGVVSFGRGTSRCTANLRAHTTMSAATGSRFALDALARFGGPRVTISGYQVICRANRNGTVASWRFSGLTGLGRLPMRMPQDYTVRIYGIGGRLLARAIFNEVIPSHPADGGTTLNLLHLILLPQRGTTGGDVIVGATACAPTS